MVINVEAYRNLELLTEEAGKSIAARVLDKPIESVEHVRLIGINTNGFTCTGHFSALIAGYPYVFDVPCCPTSGTLKEEISTEGYEWVKYY